jgi:hypothetical protein
MARARNIGNVYAELSVKDKMTVGVKRAEKSFAAFGKKIIKIGAGLAAALPAAAFAGLAASMKSAIDAGGKLSDMMARTGADGEQLFIMQRAFENAGMSGDKVAETLNKMQKALAGVNEEGVRVQTRVFDDLGLDPDELRKMDAALAFQKISESISKIPDAAKKVALAREIFGRSGGELLVMMNDGKAFEVASKQVGGLGKALSENAEKFDKISDSMGTLGVKAQQIGAEMAAELLPALESIADAMNAIDLGQQTKDAIDFAKAMAKAAEKAWEISKNTPGIGYGFDSVKGFLEKGIGWAGYAFGEEQGMALKTSEAWIGGDPMANYNEGVMLPAVEAVGEIPDMLKRMKWLEFAPSDTSSTMADLYEMMNEVNNRKPDVETMRDDRTWDNVSAEVNSMQARGLGMGAVNVPKEVNEQVSLLEQIRDVLRRAREEGDMIFA